MPQVEKRQPGVRRSATLSKHWGLIALNFRGNAEGFSGLSFSRVSNFFASMWTGDHFFPETFWPLSHKKEVTQKYSNKKPCKSGAWENESNRTDHPTNKKSCNFSVNFLPWGQAWKTPVPLCADMKTLVSEKCEGLVVCGGYHKLQESNPFELTPPGCSQQKYVHQDFLWGQSWSVSSRSHVEVVACQHTGNQKLTTGSWLVEGVSFKCAEFLLTRDLKLLHIYIPLSIRVFLGHILPIWINCCNSNLLSSFLIFLFFSELPIFGAKKKAATTRNDGRLLHKMSMSPSRWMYRQTRKKNVEKLKRWGCHFFLVTRCFHWVWGKSSHGVQELSLCNLLQQHQGSSAGASILLWKVYTNLRISMPASPTPYPS